MAHGLARPPDARAVTEWLQRWGQGESAAADAVVPLLYRELHQVAVAYFRNERAEHTLQPTALIHEAFLRLDRQEGIAWRSRRHFLAIVARLMRQVLVEHARARLRLKRGGEVIMLPLLTTDDLAVESPERMVGLDEALTRLALEDPQKASVVEMRFFAGLTLEETAASLGVSTKTVSRQWRRARAWLFRELRYDGGSDD